MKSAILVAILIVGICSLANASPMMTIAVKAGGAGTCTPSTGAPGTGVVCPLGDYGWFSVVVSDPMGNPNDIITCRAGGVIGALAFCPGTNPQVAPLGPALQVTFVFKNFGGCDKIFFIAQSSDGTVVGPTAPIFVTSFDENASLVVDGIDLARFAADFGFQGRPCSDFNCDGIVNALDFSILARHFGHRCLPTQ
ncbi:MAG TPA: hypothetical protein VMU02_02630 [bacterium]|nr:hypothetical protein [bacterium]